MREVVFLPHKRESVETSIATVSRQFGGVAIADTDENAVRAASSAGIENVVVPMAAIRTADLDGPRARVIDTVKESGASLIALDVEEGAPLPSTSEGAFYPVVYYEPAQIQKHIIGRRTIPMSFGPSKSDYFILNIRYSNDEAPVANSVVKMIIWPGTVSNERISLSVVTNEDGQAIFPLRGNQFRNVHISVEAGREGHWGGFVDVNETLSGDIFHVDRIDLLQQLDCVRVMATGAMVNDGTGVRIAIIDSGVGPHPDLSHVIGDDDDTSSHGTHVAGVIGSRANGIYQGLAPAAELRSYRVFDDQAIGQASNFSVHKAIEQAVIDDCHLVNMSLKVTSINSEPVVGAALAYAKSRGVLCFSAAGNDGGKLPVGFPARHPDCVAVAACGHLDGLPDRASDRWTITNLTPSTPGSDQNVFFGKFSNRAKEGTSIDIIAPGCGVVSTLMDNGYGPMSGTSMACPVAVGSFAQHLSSSPNILNMAAGAARYDHMIALMDSVTSSIGLAAKYEGQGMIPYGHGI